MNQPKGKVGATPNTREEFKAKQGRTPDQATGTKEPTGLPKPGQTATAHQARNEEQKKDKRKKKVKEDTKVETSRPDEGSKDVTQTRKDTPWFGTEEEKEEPAPKENTKKKPAKETWDETSEEEQEVEQGREAPEGTIDERATQDKGTRKTSEDVAEAKTEKQSPLTKFSRADKAVTRALIKISSLVGDNEALQEQIDVILTEQARFKNIILKQHEELAFLKGRICEMEKHEKRESEELLEPTLEEQDRKPTYALVVSSGTLKKQEVAAMIKKNIDPTELGIKDAAMKQGRDGVILTTTSKEDAGKLEHLIQQNARNVQVKRAKENKFPIKIVGIDEEEDMEKVVERIIEQNHLPCEPDDIILKKNWKGRQGRTAVFALNRKGYQALNNKSHLNIGWDRCRVFEHFFIPRCTKCADYGHGSFECESSSRCVNCGRRGHTQQDCTTDPYCHVCEKEERQGRGHSMMAWECPVYLDKVREEKKRILARLV